MSRHRGNLAEQQALHYLQRQGLQLIVQNFQARCGEIDLIMRDGKTLVFIEVRQRANSRYARAAHTIDQHKQRRIANTAALFLQKHPVFQQNICRFDVITFDGFIGSDTRPTWIQAAFSRSQTLR